MKRKVFNFSLMASVGLLAFAVVGCSGSKFDAPEVRITSGSVIELNVGETKQVKVSVEKSYASAPIRWFSSDEKVAFFRDNSSGYVTGVGEGEATVTAAIAGGFADCKVIVSGDGGDPDAARFTLQSSATLEVGQTTKLSYSVNPVGSTITFTSNAPGVADVDASGTVSAIAVGSAIIHAVCSNDIERDCYVTVTEGGGGGGTGDLDIGVDSNLGLSGKLYVGSPEVSKATMRSLLADFNRLTNSNIDFQITDFEDGSGVSNFPTGAASGPDLFPFVSDQTMSLNNLGALTAVEKSTRQKYQTTMLEGSVDAAKWGINYLGYPFAADNGVVMFYDSSKVSSPDEIDTIDKLFAKAEATNTQVGLAMTNGFYGASTLHTFNNGVSMFTITAQSTSSVSSSTFNCENGLKGLKLAYKIMTEPKWTVSSKAAPGDKLLATIIDTSNVREFKQMMGSKYAVAPTPYIDENHTERLCTYLGYKFYGVNGASTRKDVAHKVAQFLVSEYAQNYRFQQEKTQPTLISLQNICAAEPHIAALNAQKASNSTLLLSIFGDEYFNNTGVALTTLLNDYIADDIVPTDDDYTTILRDLDNSWQ